MKAFVNLFGALTLLILPTDVLGQTYQATLNGTDHVSSVVDTSCISNPELIGVAKIDGTEKDRTGLADVLDGDTPHDQFGGISAIDWIPGTDKFRILSDRGPQDGAVNFLNRFHELELKVDLAAASPVTARVLSSTLLKNPQGKNFVGAAAALTSDGYRAHRLDPEGLRVDRDGFNWISDEYGPCLFCFDHQGQQVQDVPIPDNLKIGAASANPDEEDQFNQTGRRSNRGMEGLAITPCGCFLVGLMQSPLIQDGYTDDAGKVIGYNSRLIRFDRKTGQTQQFVYRQEHHSHKMHEILAVDENRFLVIEQDGKLGPESSCKQVYLIDLTGATDVSMIANLPCRELPSAIVPVKKSPVLNLLDQKWGLAATMPEKVEGLSWGKPLPDSRRTLVIATDNDFRKEQATMFYVFAFQSPKPLRTITGTR
jgi:hypothetical protein